MYNPKAFQIDDPAVAAEFMRRFNFAIIVTTVDGVPEASHVPFIVDTSGPGLPGLFARFARANPQWQAFDGTREALVIFQGPHGYISPSLYETHPAVPTWNYQAVHAYGIPRVLEGTAQTRAHVLDLLRQHETARTEPWQPEFPDGFLEGLLPQIVAFRIDLTRVEAKFKLSQNRGAADQENVTSAFEASSDPVQRDLGRAMRASPRLPDEAIP
jgi:transcriptional regulator